MNEQQQTAPVAAAPAYFADEACTQPVETPEPGTVAWVEVEGRYYRGHFDAAGEFVQDSDVPDPSMAAPETATAAPAEEVRVRFLERNTSYRGDFEPGDETTVNVTRARIWAEGGVVEIVEG